MTDSKRARHATKVMLLTAVIGQQFDLPVLARTAQLSEDGALDHLDEPGTAALGKADSTLRACILTQLAAELVYTAEHDRPDALSAEALTMARRMNSRIFSRSRARPGSGHRCQRQPLLAVRCEPPG